MRRLEFTGFFDYVSNGVTFGNKPAPATLRMVPEFFVRTFGVLAIEQVVGPFGIAELIRLQRPLDTRLTAIAILGFCAIATPGTSN
jgi:hypothetical protein